MATETTGSCTCGSIKWSTTSNTLGKSFCYCLACQKWTGSAFWAAFGLPGEKVLINGRPSSEIISDDGELSKLFSVQTSRIAKRLRCKECGTPVGMLYYQSHPGRISVGLGTVDEVGEGVEWVHEGHIFVREKAEWYEIRDDGMEMQWEEWDEEFGKVVKEVEKAEGEK